MIVTLINPQMGRYNNKVKKRKFLFSPLTISTIKGFTPKDIEIKFFDERIEDIDFLEETDLVGITVETYTAKRAYEICEVYRKKGIPIVLGGFHPTLVPKESIKFADSVVIGPAESIWPQIINDFKKGKLKKFYKNLGKYNFNRPDNSIFNNKNHSC